MVIRSAGTPFGERFVAAILLIGSCTHFRFGSLADDLIGTTLRPMLQGKCVLKKYMDINEAKEIIKEFVESL